MTNLAKSAESYVGSSRARWPELVNIALSLKPKAIDKGAARLAELAGESKATVKQKILAIRFAYLEGKLGERLSVADIKAQGQSKTIAGYVKSKNGARTDKQVALTWRVAPELRDAAREQSVRVAKLLHFTTSNEYIEWWISQQASVTDEEILHTAGMLK